MNLVSNTSDAVVKAGVTATTASGDDVTFKAENNVAESASALPYNGGGTGAKVGIGASVALNIATNTAQADLESQAQLIGARDLTLDGSSNESMATDAESGAASTGGVAVSPSVAISLANNSTVAQLGAGATLGLSGALSASANHTGSTVTTSGGTAAGASAAVGAAIALTLGSDQTTATTERNLNAGGAVDFRAIDTATTSATATASAAGGQQDDGKGDQQAADGSTVDSQNSAQRGFADSEGSAAARGPRARPRPRPPAPPTAR